MARDDTDYRLDLAIEIKKNYWKLIFKSMIKLMIIILVLFNFLYVYPVISMMILFLAYFTMPATYSTDEPWKGIEAWVRMIVGYCIASLLWSILTFGGTASGFLQGLLFFPVLANGLGGGLAMPIYFITLAFFFMLPNAEHAEIGIKGVLTETKYESLNKATNYIKGMTTKDNIESADKILFLIFCLIGGICIMFGWLGKGASTQLSLIFSIFWLLCLASGYTGGSQGRPYIGVMMLTIVILIFSFQYTGIVGDVIFGQYWPTVDHYGSMVLGPIGDAFGKASEGISNAWLMISCPTCYAQQQEEEQRAKSTKISEHGTVKSIELEQFKAINYGTAEPNIDPTIPLIGSIILENKGEFTAQNINVTFLIPKVKDPIKTGAAYDSNYDCFDKCITDAGADEATKKECFNDCTYVPLYYDNCVFMSCTGLDLTEDSACLWMDKDNKISNPGDKKVLMFKCGLIGAYDRWADGGANPDQYSAYLDRCNCYETKKTTQENVLCSLCGKSEIAGYVYADYYTSISMEYSFEYTVTMQQSVDIMDRTIYMDKLLNNDIKPESIESKYSGGPVMMSMWLQDQPLRAEEESFITISTLNNGKGKVMNGAELTFRIPADYIKEGSIEYVSSTRFKSITAPVLKDREYVITAKLKADKGWLEKDDIASFTVSFKGELPEDVIEKSTVATGDFLYNYTNSKDLEFPVIKMPIQ